VNQSLVSFEDVNLGYGRRPVLTGLRFSIHLGDFLGIVGPNGAGKTTILRGILGLLRPLQGRISLSRGQSREPVHFGYVPQRETVDESYPFTLRDVVMMGRYRRIGLIRWPGTGDRDQTRRALNLAGLEDLADRPFRDLSGGQKQRALIARALAAEPDLLVLDEPTSGLDLTGETAIMSLIERLHRESGITVVMVSHQLNTVARWVKRIGILHKGLLEIGALDEILTSSKLERVYGPGAGVVTVGGSKVIVPPESLP